MSDFKTLKGLFIKHVSSDPSNLIEGQIWYNTTTQTLKVAPKIAAWSSGEAMTTAREGIAEFGIQTAAVGAGGESGVGGLLAATEEYDGTDWTAGGDLGTARRITGGAGTLTAGLVFGGHAPPPINEAEEYDGTSWADGGTLNTGRHGSGSAGIQTSALCTGGGLGVKADAESYNGTGWTAETDMSQTRIYSAGAGATADASLAIGGTGSAPPTVSTANVESWNGASWTEGPNLNSARTGLAATGTQTAAITFGGQIVPGPGRTVNTEVWDGSSWTETSNMATARNLSDGAAGTTVAAVAFGGSTPPVSALTEEFNEAIQ